MVYRAGSRGLHRPAARWWNPSRRGGIPPDPRGPAISAALAPRRRPPRPAEYRCRCPLRLGQLREQRQQQAPGAGAEIDDVHWKAAPRDQAGYQRAPPLIRVSLSGRGSSVAGESANRGSRIRARPEDARMAHHPSPFEKRLHFPRDRLGIHRPLGPTDDRRGIDAEAERDQQPRLMPRLGDAGSAEPVGGRCQAGRRW